MHDEQMGQTMTKPVSDVAAVRITEPPALYISVIVSFWLLEPGRPALYLRSHGEPKVEEPSVPSHEKDVGTVVMASYLREPEAYTPELPGCFADSDGSGLVARAMAASLTEASQFYRCWLVRPRTGYGEM